MSVRKNRSGRWFVHVKARKPNGEIVEVRRVSPVQTKRGAQRFEHEIRSLILHGEWRDPKTIEPAPTLEQWAEIFVRDHSEAKQLRPSTIAGHRQAFRTHLIPTLGASTPIDQISTPHFDRLRRALTAKGRKPKTVNNVIGVLSRAVGFYYQRQGLPVPHFDSCRVKVPRSAVTAWESEQYAALVQAATELGPRYLVIVLLMGDAGLRQGELVALEWSHVQWEPRPALVVQRSCWRGVFGPTKGAAPRTVPMTRRLAAAIRAYPRTLRFPWVLTRELDGEISHLPQGVVERAVGVVERAAGLGRAGKEEGRSHQLRHTFVTRLAASGVTVRTIMELAGHRHLSTSLRYMHCVRGATDDAISLLEAADQRPEHHRSIRSGPKSGSGS